MHLIELIGPNSATSTFRGEEIKVTKKTKDPIPPICRVLIEMGLEAQAVVNITRNGRPVWNSNRTAGDWAAIDIHENDAGIRWRKHEPYRVKESSLP